MGYQDQRPIGLVTAPVRFCGNQFGDQWQAPVGDVDATLPAVRGPRRIVAPGHPGPGRYRIDLGMRHALPVAEVGLPQPVVDGHRQPAVFGECQRRVVGAPQIRGHDEQRLSLGQYLRGGHGLGPAEVAEIGVELTLHATAGVELGLPVAQHDQPTDHHDGSATGSASTSSRSTCTRGQSRHSRSSA